MQTYSHNDIQRYLQHNMTPREMHDFEKALMNDPFLAEALEGFSACNAELTEKHLSEIESELIGEKEKGKVVAMPLQKAAWWKVAAVVLAVISFGILTYSLFSKRGVEKNFAQKLSPQKATKAATETDSIEPVEKPLAQVEVLPKKELSGKNRNTSRIVRKRKDAPIAVTKIKADSPGIAMMDKREEPRVLMNKNINAVTALTTTPATANAADVIKSRTMAMSSPASEYEFEGRVVDTSNQPLSGATISILERNITTMPDSNGNFTLKAKDSVLTVNVKAPGYAPKEVMIKTNSPINVVLYERTQSLSEVVVSDLTKKKRTSNLRQLNEKTSQDAEPEGGWENFEGYLNRRIDSIKANDPDKHYAEKVKLEFSVNKEGRPTEIKALEDSASITSEKIIQIFSNGPKWKNKKKDKKVRIIIPFE